MLGIKIVRFSFSIINSYLKIASYFTQTSLTIEAKHLHNIASYIWACFITSQYVFIDCKQNTRNYYINM